MNVRVNPGLGTHIYPIFTYPDSQIKIKIREKPSQTNLLLSVLTYKTYSELSKNKKKTHRKRFGRK